METIQIVLDSELKEATDRAAHRSHLNRSALIREAIREYLKKLELREMEERHRKGYERIPDDPAEALEWETEAAWPEE